MKLSYANNFFSQPKAHLVKNTEKHHIFHNDILKLQKFFEGYNDSNVAVANTKQLLTLK